MRNWRVFAMSSSSSDHKEVIRQEFMHQAQAYASNPLIADQSQLMRLVQLVRPQPQDRVLDDATGPGLLAIAIAEAGSEVVGIDPPESPLAIAERTRRA